MNQNATRYLGEEKLSKLMLQFSVPCIFSLLVSALYNVVDQIFIGNSSLSTLGNAATGVVFPIFIISNAFAWCIGDGVATYLNIAQGQNDHKTPHKVIGTGITLTLIISVLLVVLIMPFKTELLYLFGASSATIDMAIEYFDVILICLPISMIGNVLTPIIRADGSPKWSMISILAGAIVNIILDAIFIFVLNWGMFGAAFATVLGQAATAIISIIYILKAKTFTLKLNSLKPRLKMFSKALQYGASTFITQIMIVGVTLVCNIMLVREGALSSYGVDVPIAVFGIMSKVFTVVINIVVGIVIGCAPIISYNYGAKNYKRVKTIFKYMLISTVIVGLLSTLIFQIAPQAVAIIFGKPTNIPNPDDYFLFAEKTFRIYLSLITFTCITKLVAIFFQAVGKPLFSVLCSLVRDVIALVPLVILLPKAFAIDGILYAAPIADAIAIILVVILSIIFIKDLNKKLAIESK